MRLSRTPRGAFLELLWRRVQLQWRGLDFDPRRESEVPKALLQKVDVCWSTAIGLAMVDVMRSTPYQAKNVLWALRAGEPYRATRALIMEMAFSSVGGGRTRRRTRKIEERCRTLVAEIAHAHTDGLFAMTQGVAANLEGRFAESLEHFERAERILRERCTGMNWELDNVHIYSLVSLYHMGAWGEVRRRAEPLVEEARERNDHFLRTHIETRQLFLLRLMEDDPAGAGGVQELALVRWSGSGFTVPHYWDWYARGEIDLYAGRLDEAGKRLDHRWGEYRRSLLPYTQAIQTEILFLRVRVDLALAASSRGSSERALRRVTKDIRALDGHDTEWSGALASLARALAATLEPDRDPLRELVEVAELRLQSAALTHYARSLRWRLGDLIGGDAGVAMADDARAWMTEQGVRSPERMREMLTPGSWA
jgi:tetratricopeptide (TPR) repeat protein